MRPYMLRHPLGLALVVGLAIADAAWHVGDIGKIVKKKLVG